MSELPTRLSLVVHGSTRATATAAFPADEELEVRALVDAEALRPAAPRADRWLRGAERACEQTCDALDRAAVVDPGLRTWDAGRWRGRTLDDVAVEDPAAVEAWLCDPAAAPHDGESLLDLLERVRRWLGAAPSGHTAAVCGPAVARAAVVVVLGAPPTAFWRVDAAPLTVTDLRGGPSRWTVRATGRTPGDAGTP